MRYVVAIASVLLLACATTATPEKKSIGLTCLELHEPGVTEEQRGMYLLGVLQTMESFIEAAERPPMHRFVTYGGAIDAIEDQCVRYPNGSAVDIGWLLMTGEL